MVSSAMADPRCSGTECPVAKGMMASRTSVPARRFAVAHDLGREAVAALVNSLDARFRLKPRAQAGQALGNAVGRHMHIAPQSIFQLHGRDHLAGVRQQQPQRRQLLGRQVNHRLTAPQRAIGLQPEAGKGTGRRSTPAAKSYLGTGISTPAAKACPWGARSPLRRPGLAPGTPESPLRRPGLASVAPVSPRRRPEPISGDLESGALRETGWGSFVAATSLPHILGDTVAGLLSFRARRMAATNSGRGNLRGKTRRRNKERSSPSESLCFVEPRMICELQTIRFRHAGEECAGVPYVFLMH